MARIANDETKVAILWMAIRPASNGQVCLQSSEVSFPDRPANRRRIANATKWMDLLHTAILGYLAAEDMAEIHRYAPMLIAVPSSASGNAGWLTFTLGQNERGSASYTQRRRADGGAGNARRGITYSERFRVKQKGSEVSSSEPSDSLKNRSEHQLRTELRLASHIWNAAASDQ